MMEAEASTEGEPKAIADLRDAVNIGTAKLVLLSFITGGFWLLIYVRELYAHIEAVSGAPMNLKKGWREGWLGMADWSKPDIIVISIACIWFFLMPVSLGSNKTFLFLAIAAWGTLALWAEAVGLAIRQYTEREFGFNFPTNKFAVYFFNFLYLNDRINRMAESQV